MEALLPGLKLFYTDSGKTTAPAVVFIHGFPFNHTMWSEQAALCSPHFRVITYDQRGHGHSDAGQGRYFFEFFVDDLIGLLDVLKIKQAVLCGLSMGGYVALRTMERHPDRVLGLILCDTRSEADTDPAKLKRAADLRLIQDDGLKPFAEKFSRAVLSPSNLKDSVLLDRVQQMMLGNTSVGVQGTLMALATRTDTTPSLSRIHVPTLILVGADDAITPPAAAQAMHDRIAESILITIPAAGHLSNLDQPSAFNPPFGQFLDQFVK